MVSNLLKSLLNYVGLRSGISANGMILSLILCLFLSTAPFPALKGISNASRIPNGVMELAIFESKSIFEPSSALAQAGPSQVEVPRLDSPVIDEAQIFSASESQSLKDLIFSIFQKSGPQIQIWTIPSLLDEPIESLSIRATDQFKLGSAEKDNGILILLALQERKLRIEVGQGLEGDITDLQSKRVIDKVMKPLLREQNYYLAFSEATIQLAKLSGVEVGSPAGSPKRRAGSKSKLSPLLIILLFIVVMVLNKLFGRHVSFGSRNRWGGSSGPGWGGGGGGFSGGGASGDW
jgi:uncharacterized protein